MATVTWVLVSNAAEARLFKSEGCNTGLHLVQDWQHPDSRKHQDELVTDAGGRVQQSFAAGARPGIEWQTSPKEAEMQHFANELATYLGGAKAECFPTPGARRFSAYSGLAARKTGCTHQCNDFRHLEQGLYLCRYRGAQ